MGGFADLSPVAEVRFLDQEASQPGWYLQYSLNGRPVSHRLDIEVGADAFGAVLVAAGLLECQPEQIQVAGATWPQPLHGLLPT